MTRTAPVLYARPSPDYAVRRAALQTFLRQAAHEHAPHPQTGAARLCLACSLGAEDMLLAHGLIELQLPVDICVLDTGRLHPETLLTLEHLTQKAKGLVKVFHPDPQAADAFVAKHGEQAMYRSLELRKTCCAIRKLEPLARALAGKTAWITGLRREQSSARAEVPLIDTTDPARIKYNPLADWTWGDIWYAIATEGVAYHPLHDRFFPSIGCAPCTRAVSLGEDFRAGRWWWESGSAKECGLHVARPVQATRGP